MRHLLRLLRDRRGTTLVETTLVFPLVLILTFGLVEFGHALWEYNSAEKATAAGARYLATLRPHFADPDGSDPAPTDRLLNIANDCFVATSATAGTPCAQLPDGDPTSWSATCAGGGGSCNAAIMGQLLREMQSIAPFITAANVTVEARGTRMGFVGRGAAIPLVTVRTTGLTYDFVAIDALLGFGPIAMPGFATTLVAEDQQEGTGT